MAGYRELFVSPSNSTHQRTLAEHLAPAQGMRLRAVYGTEYRDNTGCSGSPINLELVFDQISSIRLYSASDGVRLMADQQHLRPVDMSEAGEVVVRDYSHRPFFAKAIGQRLETIFAIKDKEWRLSGVRLQFRGPAFVSIVLCGDELDLTEELRDGLTLEQIQ
jgi:hypothetical protein